MTESNNPFTCQVIGNHSDVVEVLLDKTKHPRQVIANVDHHNQFKGTALWFASKYALSGITKILLAHGAHHDPLDELGSTPLMMACKRADHPVTHTYYIYYMYVICVCNRVVTMWLPVVTGSTVS